MFINIRLNSINIQALTGKGSWLLPRRSFLCYFCMFYKTWNVVDRYQSGVSQSAEDLRPKKSPVQFQIVISDLLIFAEFRSSPSLHRWNILIVPKMYKINNKQNSITRLF